MLKSSRYQPAASVQRGLWDLVLRRGSIERLIDRPIYARSISTPSGRDRRRGLLFRISMVLRPFVVRIRRNYDQQGHRRKQEGRDAPCPTDRLEGEGRERKEQEKKGPIPQVYEYYILRSTTYIDTTYPFRAKFQEKRRRDVLPPGVRAAG